MEPHPVDTLKHSDAEIEAAYVHRIRTLPFHGCHLCMGFGASRGTRCGGRRAVYRCVVVIINELVLPRRRCVFLVRRVEGSEKWADGR